MHPSTWKTEEADLCEFQDSQDYRETLSQKLLLWLHMHVHVHVRKRVHTHIHTHIHPPTEFIQHCSCVHVFRAETERTHLLKKRIFSAVIDCSSLSSGRTLEIFQAVFINHLMLHYAGPV